MTVLRWYKHLEDNVLWIVLKLIEIRVKIKNGFGYSTRNGNVFPPFRISLSNLYECFKNSESTQKCFPFRLELKITCRNGSSSSTLLIFTKINPQENSTWFLRGWFYVITCDHTWKDLIYFNFTCGKISHVFFNILQLFTC